MSKRACRLKCVQAGDQQGRHLQSVHSYSNLRHRSSDRRIHQRVLKSLTAR